jgi:nucleotide-binding universal stress UspA family protein
LEVTGGWMAADVGPVVVGTDFSDAAGVALQEARRLALLLGVDLTVVHVVEDRLVARDAGGVAASWLGSHGLESVELVVRQGQPWVELARYAAEVKPTLLVVGSHGESGFQPLRIGSTASRVSMHAGCPVVLVSPRLQAPRQERGTNTAGRVGAAAGARDEPGSQQL